MREAIPKGEEVGVCKFKCECGNGYTVRCRMCDTAECYECGEQDVEPVPDSITFRRIWKKPGTPNKHSCCIDVAVQVTVPTLTEMVLLKFM